MDWRRKVEPVPDFTAEVLESFKTPSAACVEGADFLLEELERSDPDLDERCGLLANRYEIYALKIPNCASHLLIASLDTAGKRPWHCIVHGLTGKGRNSRFCETGRKKAVRQFKLVNPSWEPADDI